MRPHRVPSVIANPGEVWYPPKATIIEMHATWHVIRHQLDAPLRDRAWRGTLIQLITPVQGQPRVTAMTEVFLTHN